MAANTVHERLKNVPIDGDPETGAVQAEASAPGSI